MQIQQTRNNTHGKKECLAYGSALNAVVVLSELVQHQTELYIWWLIDSGVNDDSFRWTRWDGPNWRQDAPRCELIIMVVVGVNKVQACGVQR
jgi:hypothetical protein